VQFERRTVASAQARLLRPDSKEVRESGRSEGGACSEAKFVGPTRNGRSPKDEAKPYCISRREVLEAYRKVKSNKGAARIVVDPLFQPDSYGYRSFLETRSARAVRTRFSTLTELRGPAAGRR
jgi:hypothetical protein